MKTELIDKSGNGWDKNLGALAEKLGSVECDSGSYIGLAGIWTGSGNGQSGQQFLPHTGPALETFELIRTVLDNPIFRAACG